MGVGMVRRILLSYLVIISVTIALLLFIVHQRTAQTFSRYLSDQASIHSRMLPVMLASYFVEHKSWDGVQKNIDEASVLIGSSVSLLDAQGYVVAATQRSAIGRSFDADPALGQSIPIVGGEGQVLGQIYVAHNPARQRADQAFLDDITSALVATGALVALVAMGLGVFLARSISRPMTAMAQAAAQIARGEYAVRVSPASGPEISALAQAFNHMAESIGRLEEVRRELVANVSHDLRTPLTVIRGYLEGLRSGQIADRRSAEVAFEAMYAEVTRLLRLVEDLRFVARQDAGVPLTERRAVAVSELFEDVIRRVTPFALAKQVQVSHEVPAQLPMVEVDVDQMGQALFNVLENGVNYTPSGGAIFLRAGATDAHVWLAVEDTGVGISPEHLPHVFERFYRADRSRGRQNDSGIGLGLTIARGIVECHGGQISVTSDGIAGHGSTFTIVLPIPCLAHAG